MHLTDLLYAIRAVGYFVLINTELFFPVRNTFNKGIIKLNGTSKKGLFASGLDAKANHIVEDGPVL